MSNGAYGNRDSDVDFDALLSNPVTRSAYADAWIRENLLGQLIQLRKSEGLRQSDIAARMSTTQSSISELENSSSDPYLSTLQRYARAIGYRLEIRVLPDDGDTPESANQGARKTAT